MPCHWCALHELVVAPGGLGGDIPGAGHEPLSLARARSATMAQRSSSPANIHMCTHTVTHARTHTNTQGRCIYTSAHEVPAAHRTYQQTHTYAHMYTRAGARIRDYALSAPPLINPLVAPSHQSPSRPPTYSICIAAASAAFAASISSSSSELDDADSLRRLGAAPAGSCSDAMASGRVLGGVEQHKPIREEEAGVGRARTSV